jgi:hypothetical protein
MALPTVTADPDLRLDVDGARLAPTAVAAGTYSFRVGPGASVVRLMSRTAVPAEFGAKAAGGDIRRLGVPIKGLVMRGRTLDLSLPHDDPSLTEGFHPAERGHRWTDGGGVLPASWLRGMQEGFTLEVRVSPNTLRYLTGG